MAERDDRERDLIDAIDRLGAQVDRSAEATEKSDRERAKSNTITAKALTTLDTGTSAALRVAGLYGLGKASGLFRASSTAAGTAAGTARAGAGRGLGVALTRIPIPHVVAIGVGILAAIGVSKGIKSLFGGQSGRAGMTGLNGEAQRQNELLAALLRETKQTNLSFSQAASRRRAAQDPFNRTPSFFENRNLSFTLGTNQPTESQAISAGRLTESQNNLAQANAASARINAQFTAPFETLQNDIATRQQININWWKQLGIDIIKPGPNIREFFTPETQAGRGGFLGGQAERDLFKLQTLGPAKAGGAGPTATAGTASDYRLRVQLEREELDRQTTKLWQDEVLNSLRELNKLGIGDPDDLNRANVRFGRPIEGV